MECPFENRTEAVQKVVSREYKLMLEHRWFVQRKQAVDAFWKETTAAAKLQQIQVKGSFAGPEKREIVFFDTSDHLIRRHGLILRRRVEENGTIQFTLKARNEDRYIADAVDLKQGRGLQNEPKFEEDIAAPFLSRFSHSNTIEFAKASESPVGKKPDNLEDAARLFPLLGKLKRGDEKAAPTAKLLPVHGIVACERVYKGPTFKLPSKQKATVALILWSSDWDDRPLVAEFSFRYQDKKEQYHAKLALAPAKCSRRCSWLIGTVRRA